MIVETRLKLSFYADETKILIHYFLEDPFDQVMCPSHNQIPHTDFERVDGWLTSNGAVHGTVLEYSCQVSIT